MASTTPWGSIIGRMLMLTAGGFSLYFLAPQLLDFASAFPQLADIRLRWFWVMLALQSASFFATWALTRLAVPQIGWFKAATSQLASNAVSRSVPGGAVVGAAVYWRMLSFTGLDVASTSAALAANSVLTIFVLMGLPAVAALLAAITSPVPGELLPVAVAGAALFGLMVIAGFLIIRYDRPLRFIGKISERIAGWANRRLGRDWSPSAEGLLAQRDAMVETIGPRWHLALAAAAGKWFFDYLTLMAALYAVGADPRLSVALLAFTASALLTMIPITPGGLGFVEVGLTSLLTLAGVTAGDALLATLMYRLFSFWLPIPVGLMAYFMFQHRYRKRYGRKAQLNPEESA